MPVKINNSKVKNLMLLKGLNNSELAKRCQISAAYTSQILNSKRLPSPKVAKKIAKILNVEIGDIFTIEIEEDSDNAKNKTTTITD
ncbi:helix-turn-helix transcriptional regulator [Mammaliicoccus sciuri]|uniref:helix-turn-helix transcriptional regulator n=1 Tax=Mammaliicoccus sciuri TaxID=1296 RepID=UPI0020BFC2E7|nr:helix-turn-helix transcriptional regulator [Mammaliicoccus sciuri]